MYGYVFAAAEVGVTHTIRRDVMLYPGRHPRVEAVARMPVGRAAPGAQDTQGQAAGEQAEGGGAAAALPALEAIEQLVGLEEAKEMCRNLADAVALEKARSPGCNPMHPRLQPY